MEWDCDGCGATKVSDPLAHDDTGGVITVYGPHCEDCDQRHHRPQQQ
jgi:hypothetical protein